MSSSRSKTAPSPSVDVSQHPGYVNLGNTCFFNSALQALSATQSLKQLYTPEDGHSGAENDVQGGKTPGGTPGPSSRRPSIVTELLDARTKSPVIRLADEEHGRQIGPLASSSGSRPIEVASISAIAQQAVANPTPADIQSIRRSDNQFSPTASDVPLNTAFRLLMEKSWQSSQPGKSASLSANSARPKVSAISPKSLLNEMSIKYDQYGEYRQQDGHELVRHLLDSLRMEELDVIKKIQPPVSKKERRRLRANNHDPYTEQLPSQEVQLKPLVDNLFCGKLLSFVVCESCRHVSHTYEDFYDISLSLRAENEAKESSKRQRIRNMADKWRQRSTSASAAKGEASDSTSKPLQESLAMLRDGYLGSLSDTEQGDDVVRRSNSRMGRRIARPKSAADPAKIDANSKEGSKTFIKRQMQQSDPVAPLEKSMDSLSVGDEKKRDILAQTGAASLFRAVSGRRTPISRTSSPFRSNAIREVSEGEESEVAAANGQAHARRSPSLSHSSHHHHKKSPSKHALYLSRLLVEAPPQPQPSNLSALLWGRRAPSFTFAEPSSEPSQHKRHSDNTIEAQQANTGLVRALHHFTAVEVLDGPNSFACKRCWRILNPPTAVEQKKLRLRRMRRGKDVDESEMSSDDESSSDEEMKEKAQKAALKREKAASAKGSSAASSVASITDDVAFADTSIGADTSAELTGDSQGVSTSAEPIRERKDGTPTPLTASTSQGDSEEYPGKRSAPIVVVRSATASSPPVLRAPKPVLAAPGSLTFSNAGNGGSSDEASNEGLTDRESDASDLEGETSGEQKRQRAIRYADEEVSTITKPAQDSISAPLKTRKRSAHSVPRRALKRFLIAETPKVLVFHFKRFQATGRGFSFATSFRKIDDPITFPEYLDVRPWMAPPREEYDRHGQLKQSSDPRALKERQDDIAAGIEAEQTRKGHHAHGLHAWGWRPHPHHGEKNGRVPSKHDAPKTKYRLYGVVVHQGSMSGGHYTAYVLSDRASDLAKAATNSKQTESGRKGSPKDLVVKGAKSDVSKSDGESVRVATPSLSSAATTPATNATSSVAGGTTAPTSEHAQSPADPVSNVVRVEALSSVSSLGSDLGEAGAIALDPIQASPDLSNALSTTATGPVADVEVKKDNRRWIFASDSLVRPATIEEVLKAQAYMLFYEQM